MTIHTHDDAYEPAHSASQTAHALDELQLAELDSRVLGTSSSHLFLHILAPFDKTPEETICDTRSLPPAPAVQDLLKGPRLTSLHPGVAVGQRRGRR